MRIYTKMLLPAMIVVLTCGPGRSQDFLPSNVSARVDSLFRTWNSTSGPGWAVGVVRNDSLVFARGYGMANLEYGVPISPQTIFHMASVSKQFTAFSIVLLARSGKVRFDDDIRKYLPWFPDMKEKITVRQLLNHTSGIRDQWQLLAIAGTRLDDVITQDQIVKVLAKQRALNFKPGEEWLYSNSGFTLLAEIVKAVSGQTFRAFTDSAIFQPLGMLHTHFHDDYTEIVPNRAYSYQRNDKGKYINAVLSYSNVGATSLFTNIEDMSKWVMNFYEHRVGDQADIDQLTERAKLNNGKLLNYAMGIVVDSMAGKRRFQHDGADAGYRTFVSVFPELKMGFIVFSNLANVNSGSEGDQLAALFLDGYIGQRNPFKASYRDSAAATPVDSAGLASWLGFYTSEDGARFQFLVHDKRLYWVNPTGRFLMIREGKDTIRLFNDSTVRFVFSQGGGEGAGDKVAGRKTNGKKAAWDKVAGEKAAVSRAIVDQATVSDEYWPGNHRHLWKYDTSSRPDAQLLEYTGTYYCPELDCNYRIVLHDHHLFLRNAKYDDAALALLGDDFLHDDLWWMPNLRMYRDSDNKIKGFEVNAGRVRHLWFQKAEQPMLR